MKKTTLTAGALLLLIACNRSAAERDEAPRAVHDPMIALVDAVPPAAPSEGVTEGYTFNGNADMDVSLSADTTGPSTVAADQWASTSAEKPDVGRAISSRAAVQGTDTARRFIRTADLRFRVKDVVQATLGIEDIVGAHAGWITRTELRSHSRGQNIIPVSEDSLLEVTRYELVNTITLRVPNTELDSTLRQIGRWVDLFDHRTILADDIRLRMMANAMAVRRAKAHSMRVAEAIDDQGRKLKETLAAEEALQASDERRDQGLLNNMELADRVAYSTVTIDIHQRPLVRREMIANERSIDGYRPSLWSRLGDALLDGWRLLELLITGLIAIWPVLLLLGGSLWLLRRTNRKRKAERAARVLPPPPGA